MKSVLAFDIGASSGRGILGQYEDGLFTTHEVHRFENFPKRVNDGLYWDIDTLFHEIISGIKKAQRMTVVDSIGIDTWGVDFGLIGKDQKIIHLPRCYRDQRNQHNLADAARQFDLKAIYQLTGNQLMDINTLFQLYRYSIDTPEIFEEAETLLLMPDLLNFLLTGETKAELSIASTTQLIDPWTNTWNQQVITQFGFSPNLFPEIVYEGNILGETKESLGIGRIPVINVCQHDTASAVVSVPNNKKVLFVSCGTWSLIGTELTQPIINEQAYQYNLTNEKGADRTTRFLKNVTGLWIIQELKREFAQGEHEYSFAELAELAAQATPFGCVIDTENSLFVSPGNMTSRIDFFAKKTGQKAPETIGAYIRCVYESLALKYKETFLELNEVVESEFDQINIVGGGANVAILCQMVANAANMVVIAGPVEATAIGNIGIQLVAQGEFPSVQALKEWLKTSEQRKSYFPSEAFKLWNRTFSAYKKITEKAKRQTLVEAYCSEKKSIDLFEEEQEKA